MRTRERRVHIHKTPFRERRIAAEPTPACVDCGLDIPREHLREEPRATRCVVCEMAREAA